MKKIIFIFFVLTLVQKAFSQTPPPQPELEFAMQLRVKIDAPYSCENTPNGTRTIIPITGGEFSGPKIKGIVINGGADYQMSNGNRTTLEAIYCIKTDDNIIIHVRNCGIIYTDKNEFYFKAAPKFEAPQTNKCKEA